MRLNPSKLVLAVVLLSAILSCKKNSAVDDLVGSEPDRVIVEVPEDLQVTITTPNADGKKVGYQVYMSGGCTLPGATVEFRGGATGYSVCQGNNTWEANVDVSGAAVGNITVEAYLVDGDDESGVATRVLNKTNADCNTSSARAAVYAAGAGTIGSPYSVCTSAQFNNIRLNPTSHFALKNDIDLQNVPFSPIPNTFAGVLDGDGFILKRLYIYDLSGNDVGLFKGIRDGAIVRELTIETSNVTGPSVIGTIAGRILGTGATISDLTLTSAQITATTDYIGGLVGHVNAAATLTVSNVTVALTSLTGRNYGGGILGSSNAAAGAISIDHATVSGAMTMSNSYAGGIVGYIPSASINLDNVTNSASITNNGGTADNYVGGIAGAMTAGGDITTCASSGAINATGSYVGGVAGWFTGTKIWNCSVTGTIQGDSSARAVSYVGGIVGYATATTTDLYQSTAKVNISVTGTNVGGYYGGLGGRFYGARIQESHAHGSTSTTKGTITINMGDGLTTGSSQVGGAFGRIDIANSSTLNATDTHALIDVSFTGYNTDVYVGGYVGYLVTPDGATASTGNFTNSYATGDISASNRSVGGWAGQIYVSRSGSRITLDDVYATGDLTVVSRNSITPHYIGGLVGYAACRDGSADVETAPGCHTWTDVYATGDVNVDSGTLGGNYVAGLAGYFYTGRTSVGGGSSTISHAYATGTVTATSTSTDFNYVGGLIGRVHLAQSATTTIDSTGGQTYATGNVTGHGQNVGGLIGYVSTSTSAVFTLNDVYSNGNVVGRTYVGGAIGYLSNGTTATMNISDIQSHDSSSATTANSVQATTSNAGGLVGRAESTATTFLINSCESIASVTSAGGYAGGLIGQDRANVDISNCTASGAVASPQPYVGGLTGGSDQTGRDFTNVSATGNVRATVSGAVNNIFVGGLSGYMRGSITNAYATGNVLIEMAGGSSINQAMVGGLVGYANGVIINKTYATGDVYFDTFGAGNQSFTGGLVGYMVAAGGSVANSFATGDVDGGLYTGGLIGYNRATVTNSFAAGAVSGTRMVGGLIGDHDGAAGSVNLTYALGSVTRNALTSTDRFGQLIGFCNGGGSPDGKVTNSFYNATSSTIDPVITTPQTTCNSATPARSLSDINMLSPGAGLTGTFDFVGTLDSSWRYPTAFTKKNSATVFPYPIPYWALP